MTISSRRTARVAAVIREVVSTSILLELRDPRIKNVTVLGAEVSSDLRYARIKVSVMGTEKDAALTLHGLESARGYLQSKVADRVKTRYTPELSFEIDTGIRKSIEASRILKEVLPQSEDSEDEENMAESDPDQDLTAADTESSG